MARWRRRAVVVLLGIACGGLLLASTTQPWVVASLPAGPGGTGSDLPVAGSTATAVVPALGLVALAGAVALSTLKGVGRAVAAVLLVLVALGAAASVAALVADPVTAARAAARAATGVPEVEGARVTTWPLLALLPTAGVVLVGVVALVSGRAWATSARFEAPSAAPDVAAARPSRPAAPSRAGLWDDLSQGVDPTLDEPADRPADRPAEVPTDAEHRRPAE
ncbi:Trp biosynthesis-associated membrane protein [Quadrisphaera sp. INWT6]|uniref:Trp biosynthesis-associated membrane protein n=1 Tax=Quadrisphaera sp. INWT6 TaxID=2596917 RepID=UPI0018923CCB|nr:Trp biosynthesis-associated membrane protein [Quadrisphaera sp. INWT6]